MIPLSASAGSEMPMMLPQQPTLMMSRSARVAGKAETVLVRGSSSRTASTVPKVSAN
jgi:hypothetical protein